MIPGGELVNDLGFEFVLAIGETHRVIYPAYPPASSIEELADALRAILDAEGIGQVAILGASFDGAVARCSFDDMYSSIRKLALKRTSGKLTGWVPISRYDIMFAVARGPVGWEIPCPFTDANPRSYVNSGLTGLCESVLRVLPRHTGFLNAA